jgi:hypothetical protein
MASLLRRMKGAIGRALARASTMNVPRSDYKGTWKRLGSTTTNAKFYVAGHDDDSAFMASAMDTLEVLERLVAGVKSNPGHERDLVRNQATSD